MSETSYDVRIWKTETYSGKRGTVYKVGWAVDGQRRKRSFTTAALARSFRARLLSAASSGEAFRLGDGLPVSFSRDVQPKPWFHFAREYVDMKWPRSAAKSRSGNADALATATLAMLSDARGRPAAGVLRKALTGWAFNTTRRDTAQPDDVQRALRWLASNTVPVSALDDNAVVRQVLDQLALKMDGASAAAKTIARKRAVLYNALEYAVEIDLLTRNRIPDVKWRTPKTVRSIDPRVAVNHGQARALLAAVEAQRVPDQPRRSLGSQLKAYFGLMYYAALRPEEAAMIAKGDLLLPDGEGWGELLLSKTAPIAGAAWTDSGARRDRRQLKARADGEVRSVPSPPLLTALLRQHLADHGTAPDGRLFRSLNGGDVSESTVARAWNKARRAALTPEEYASPLARRPYDLRHACVSTWLAAGVPSPQAAAWAGHSVAVLHQVYAKVIAGQEDEARARVEQALVLPADEGTNRERPAG